MSLADASGERAFLVLERNDYASSTTTYDGSAGAARVDLSRDVVYIGPFEEQAHVENPAAGPARVRVVIPTRPFRLEPVFVGLARDADDEPWQHHRYLAEHVTPRYPRAIVFNSNGVDANRISTGAKDDMDFAEVERQLAVARQLGVETFVLDDGWQARSGDWCPDSPECPEPRWDGTATSKFKPRFPDASFTAVGAKLAEGVEKLRLGLWMSPMHFHPSSTAFQSNPQWACLPVSLGLVAANVADPGSSSNEAGIGTWNPEAIGTDGTRLIDYIEGRIRRAIDEWGVQYFKFDFLVWLDCAGLEPVDIYAYRESFLAMLDRLIAAHPEVTFQIDETNDYRFFPFESVARGPSWYQNGSPRPNEALHSAWILAPFVPPSSLGKSALAHWKDPDQPELE
ncbi:MAG: alpha-galactosidase, partial [Candidatus Binatia bacterium]